MYYTKAG